MKKISDQDRKQAFFKWWTTMYPAPEADVAIVPFLNSEIQPRPRDGWLRAARIAMLKSLSQVGKQAGLSRQAISQFEQKELEGKITIETLSKIAEAMDCEFVYAIRPKKKIRFSQVIWQQLSEVSADHGWIRQAQPHSKHLALAKVVSDKLKKPAIRRANSWSKRKPRPSSESIRPYLRRIWDGLSEI